MILTYFNVPYTSEFQLLGTGCATSLLTANYAPTTGVARGQRANGIFLTLENTDLRYNLNGSAPATSCGHILAVGDSMALEGVEAIQNLKILNEGGTASTYIQVTYFAG